MRGILLQNYQNKHIFWQFEYTMGSTVTVRLLFGIFLLSILETGQSQKLSKLIFISTINVYIKIILFIKHLKVRLFFIIIGIILFFRATQNMSGSTKCAWCQWGLCYARMPRVYLRSKLQVLQSWYGLCCWWVFMWPFSYFKRILDWWRSVHRRTIKR